MGMKEIKYIGPFLRIETGLKGWKVDRCPMSLVCPNDVGKKYCSACGRTLAGRWETFTEPLPNPDEVLIEQYGESLLVVLRLQRPESYTIFAISNRVLTDDDEEKGDDGSVREITGVDMTSEESQFAQEFAAEIGALHLAGAKCSVRWGEINYWN